MQNQNGNYNREKESSIAYSEMSGTVNAKSYYIIFIKSLTNVIIAASLHCILEASDILIKLMAWCIEMASVSPPYITPVRLENFGHDDRRGNGLF